jgi:hypothetical protein
MAEFFRQQGWQYCDLSQLSDNLSPKNVCDTIAYKFLFRLNLKNSLRDSATLILATSLFLGGTVRNHKVFIKLFYGLYKFYMLLYLYSQNYIFSGATLKTVFNTASNLKMFGEKFAWFALTKVRKVKQQLFIFQDIQLF